VLRYAILALAGLFMLVIFGFACVYVYLAPSLPTAESMRRVELQVPLRVYTRTGGLIAQIGEQRRIPVTYDDIPELVRQAVLAAEDDRFFSHHGIDWKGVLRAMIVNIASADLDGQGGSTITMQTARNMFLTLDKTWRRKLMEFFVTYRMERDFTKQEILATYLNVIFFGQRSYGVAAAAETFYGKTLSQLTVAEAATLAGIVQLPSRYNPITNPKAAHVRRTYVLGRMAKLGYIDEATAAKANDEPIVSRGYAPLFDVEAAYVAELARQDLINRYGPAAVNAGYKVYTTLDGRLQAAANRAVRIGLVEYDRRHGYRGAVAQLKLPADTDPATLDTLLAAYNPAGFLQPAVVLSVAATTARVHIRGQGEAQLDWSGMSWARPVNKSERMGPAPKKAADVVARGDVIYVVSDRRGNAQLGQLPEVQAALVALDPQDGAIVSMVGGFDFYINRFNRVTQARRQPGSGFKPFLYSAALENGLTPASIILDTPVVVDDPAVEEAWRPKNSGGGFSGPIPLREALVRSRNLVSIRILRQIGVSTAIDYATRFGLPREAMPEDQTLALGSASFSPLEVATGFATFANGGYKIEPYLIDRIDNAAGEVLFQEQPRMVCPTCESTAVAPLVSVAGEASPDATTPTTTVPAPATAAGDERIALMSAAAAAAAAAAEKQISQRNADVPEKLRDFASVQGGRGYLKEERVAPRVITAENAWLMDDMMADVVRRGTGARAMALGRHDLAGKTGTTNDNRDTWFNGFNSDLVATVWVGFDGERSLGDLEEGGSTALPIWVHYMREALRNLPERSRPRPAGLIDLRISPRTGAIAGPEDLDAVTETFIIDKLPPGADPNAPGYQPHSGQSPGNNDPLF
jgi:penicillin-binding protein 1A